MGLELQELKCKNCGGNLDLFLSIGRATCKHCGANYYVSGNTGNINNNSRTLYDSPTGIDIVRCDEDKPITLFDVGGWMEEHSVYPNIIFPSECRGGDGELHFRGNRPSFDEVAWQLEVLSGVSYILKKSYVINKVSLAYYRIRNIVADPKSIREAEKTSRDDYLKRRVCEKDVLREISDRTEYINKNVEKEIQAYNSLELKVEEKFIEKKSEYVSSWPYLDKWRYKTYGGGREDRLSIKGSCDVYGYSLAFPIITPDYFGKHFQRTLQKYESIKDYPVVETISGILASSINQSCSSNFGTLIFRYYSRGERIEWFCESSPHNVNYIYFHDLGMDDIADPLIDKALFLAIFQKLVEKTKKDGRYMLDLDDNYFMHTLSDYDFGLYGDYGNPESYLKKSLGNIKIRYMEVKEKKYNSW